MGIKKQWKLISKNKNNLSGNTNSINKPFVGSFEDLTNEIEKINNGNYSYEIVDFELICDKNE